MKMAIRVLAFVTAAFAATGFVHHGQWKQARVTLPLMSSSSLPDATPSSPRDAFVAQLGVVAKASSSAAAAVFGYVALAEAAEGPYGVEIPALDRSKFIKTSSGLEYLDTKLGEGASPLPGDTVKVHYTGWLEDFESEKKFDSSYDRRSPLSFKVGARQVIAGWDEALLTNMKVGGKRAIIIPSELGYGSRGAGGVIPPNATLFFKIELVGVIPK